MDGVAPGFQALPPEAPMAMAAQSFRHAAATERRPRSSPRGMFWRRLLVLGGAAGLTAFATREMHLVFGATGTTPLEIAILALFVSLFAWIALSLISNLCGFVALLAGERATGAADAELPRTALLMPAYNEAPERIMAALAVIHADLARIGAGARFDIFILSDTTDPDAWIAEEAAFLALRAESGAGNIFYRRRRRNVERKAGNIADWVRRWGGAYPQFMILDADSVMTGACIVRLARAMAATEGAGLIQSLPVIVGGQTLFARLQQFAGRLYGPMIAHGIGWWHGAEGNYWGHNAMIRTAAFAESAGLPTLPGRKPFGGHVMSHDFVEAALLRRAGWAVHMLPALAGSYEACPPSLTELAARDRRWCQGNLQHMAVLPARGLHPISRLHLLMGIGSYLTAPLWLAFLVLGILVSVRARIVPPEYFPTGPSLFPTWPVVDPVRSMWVFIGTMAVLLGPKLLAWFAMLVRREERRGFGGGLRTLLGVVVETVLAGLLAPVTMLTQSASVAAILFGRDSGWMPQVREDGRAPFRDLAWQYLPHTLTGAFLGVTSWAVSTALLLWMSPVVIGLALAAPLAALTARRGPGQALQRMGLLRTPEEAAPPEILLAAQASQPRFAQPTLDATARLTSDPALMAAHRSMLPPRRNRGDAFDPALLVGLAKLREMKGLAEVTGLSVGERGAVLTDAEGLELIEELARARNAPDVNA